MIRTTLPLDRPDAKLQAGAKQRAGLVLMDVLERLQRVRLLGAEGMAGVLADAPAEDRAIMEDPVWQRISRTNVGEALRQDAAGWTDETMAMIDDWDFELEEVGAKVTWWHGDNDKNAPLSAARRAAARLRDVDLRVWRHEGHFASMVHEAEIVRELLSRSA